MKQVMTLIAAFALCFSQIARASDSRAYIGAGLATNSLTACTSTTPTGNTSTCTDHTSGSWNPVSPRFIAGYDLGKYVSLELGVSAFGNYRVRDAFGVDVGSVQSSSATLSVKGGYQFHTGWFAFGKLGIAYVVNRYTPGPGWAFKMNNTQETGGIVMGAGGGYQFSETVGLRVWKESVIFADATYVGTFDGLAVAAIFRF